MYDNETIIYQVHVIILVLAKVPKGSNPQICSARPGWRIRGSLSKWDCRVIIVTVDHSGYRVGGE